jgi:hypothetical protein
LVLCAFPWIVKYANHWVRTMFYIKLKNRKSHIVGRVLNSKRRKRVNTNTYYTLYKNAGFWLVNSRDIFFLQIQALHCEFAEILLHVGVFTYDLIFFHGICKIVFAVFTLHQDACNKICKTFISCAFYVAIVFAVFTLHRDVY